MPMAPFIKPQTNCLHPVLVIDMASRPISKDSDLRREALLHMVTLKSDDDVAKRDSSISHT